MFNKKVKIKLKKYFQLNMPYILGLKTSLNTFKRFKQTKKKNKGDTQEKDSSPFLKTMKHNQN